MSLLSLQIILIIICPGSSLIPDMYLLLRLNELNLKSALVHTQLFKVDFVTEDIFLDSGREGSKGSVEALCGVQPPLGQPQPLPQETLQPGQGAAHLRPGILTQKTAQARPQVCHH